MDVRQRFTDDTGMTPEHVRSLIRLANCAASANEHICNGDPHNANNDPNDKNRNSELWEASLDDILARIGLILSNYRGLALEFTGIRPCIRKDKQHYINIPH